MNAGWIQLHRKFIDWEWYDDINTKVLFIHCLLKANHQEKKWRGISISRGSFLTSINKLSDETGLSMQSVRTSIKRLESTGEITRQSTHQLTRLSICKYDTYQNLENSTNTLTNKQLTHGQHTPNTALTTTNNDNNYKNYKNDKNNIDACVPVYQENKSIDPQQTIKPEAGDYEAFCELYDEAKPFNHADSRVKAAYFQAVNDFGDPDLLNNRAYNYADYAKKSSIEVRFRANALRWLTERKYCTDWLTEVDNLEKQQKQNRKY